MHIWPNKSIIKGSTKYNTTKFIASRPKQTDEALWALNVKEFKYNKLVVLDSVPKASMKKPTKDKE